MTASTADLPALSIAIVVGSRFELWLKSLAAYRAQTVATQIEAVVIAPTTTLIDDQAFDGLHSVQIARFDPPLSGGKAFAEAARRARAPVFVIGEDHAYPPPTWAETMLQDHAAGWDAVSPAMDNANPASRVSWADFLLSFGWWYAPEHSHEMDALPPHNTTYKRDQLMSFEPLTDLLAVEGTLHSAMRQRGLELYLDQRVANPHINLSRWDSHIRHCWCGGRLYGNLRAHTWSPAKRVVFALGFPLVPLVRLLRLYRVLNHAAEGRSAFWRAFWPMLIGVTWHSAGEAAGYLFGAGEKTAAALRRVESPRIDNVLVADRELMQG